MCNLFSGHVVTEKGKDWGKVLVVTGIHHEQDREHKSAAKYEENLIAWETIKKADVNSGVSFTHDCGKGLSEKEKTALKEIVDEWIKNKGDNWFIKKVAETGGSLDLSDTKIEILPDNLSVGGSLDLSDTKIEILPDNLSVGGSLYLSGTQITRLPDNLSVGYSLNLRGTQITRLPDNLSVGGSLYLSGTKITNIPKKFRGKIIR